MTDGFLSLSRYIKAPLEDAPLIEGISESSVSHLARFLPIYSNPFFIQWRNIKRATAALIDDGLLSRFSVHLTAELKARAYAVDDGRMCFSLGALLSRSSAVTLTVLCHELAHIWLSQRAFYPELKRLNREFISAFSSVRGANLMSPIEVFATVGSLCLLDAVSDSLPDGKKKKRLTRLIASERGKLEVLTGEILMLEIQDGIGSK